MKTIDSVQEVTSELLAALSRDKPELLKKPKFHLLLHLADSMLSFGPTMAYNTERYVHTHGSNYFQHLISTKTANKPKI